MIFPQYLIVDCVVCRCKVHDHVIGDQLFLKPIFDVRSKYSVSGDSSVHYRMCFCVNCASFFSYVIFMVCLAPIVLTQIM